MGKVMKRTLPITLAFIVAVAFSLMMNTDETFAAVKKPGKVNAKTIKVTKKTPTTLTIKWSKSKRANKYRIAYKIKGTKKWKYVTVKSKKAKPTKKLTKLVANKTYQIKIKAYNKTRGAAYSKIANLKTPKKTTTPPSSDDSTSGGSGGSGGTDSGGSGSSGSGSSSSSPWIGEIEVPTKTNITVNYGTGSLYIGKPWTTTLLNQMKAGATSGKYEKISRPNFANFYRYKQDPVYGWITAEESKTYSQDVYMFDTGDYDNFFIVYVTGGKVSKWTTCRSDMGKNGSAPLTRGALTTPTNGHALFKDELDWVTGVPKNGIVFGGFEYKFESINSGNLTPHKEVRIGFHLINAYRVINGIAPLIYNKYLAGVDENGNNLYYTGSFTVLGKPFTFNNQRYGAQACAETCNASNYLSDGIDPIKHTKGPMAGLTVDNIISTYASNATVIAGGVNACKASSCGEASFSTYSLDRVHMSLILDSDRKYIGMGISGKYHNEWYGGDNY